METDRQTDPCKGCVWNQHNPCSNKADQKDTEKCPFFIRSENKGIQQELFTNE